MPIRFGNHRTGRVVLVLTPREVEEKLRRRRVKGKPIDPRRIKLAGQRRKRTISKYDDSWKWERLGPDEVFVPRPAIEDDVDLDLEGIADGGAEPGSSKPRGSVKAAKAAKAARSDEPDESDKSSEPAKPEAPDKSSEPAKPDAPDDDVPDPAAVREWAREQGIEVSEKGRLPFALVDQYRAATSG